MRAKQTFRKRGDDSIAPQLSEMLGKTALTEPETFQKKHKQLQPMSHTEGPRAHQGLHRCKDTTQDLSDLRLHILHPN